MSALPLDSLPPTQPPVLPRVGHDQEETKDARGVHLAATPSPSIWETAEVTFQIDRRTITLPQFIGDYKVLRLLGVGGMGVVVVVQNQFFGREEALKMIHDRLDSEKAHDDFIREMHAQAGMDHSHIAKVNYAGVCKQEGLCRNRLYLVMPLEAGDLAAQLTANGPFPPAAAANLVRRLAKAVAHAHDRNVIHCDLKPKNILLGKDGTPKITDFGLAKYLTKAGDRGIYDLFVEICRIKN